MNSIVRSSGQAAAAAAPTRWQRKRGVPTGRKKRKFNRFPLKQAWAPHIIHFVGVVALSCFGHTFLPHGVSRSLATMMFFPTSGYLLQRRNSILRFRPAYIHTAQAFQIEARSTSPLNSQSRSPFCWFYCERKTYRFFFLSCPLPCLGLAFRSSPYESRRYSACGKKLQAESFFLLRSFSLFGSCHY